MKVELNVQEINDILRKQNIQDEITKVQKISGTTDGLVFRLEDDTDAKYILKFDRPDQILLAEQLLSTYQSSDLLPKILFTAPDKSHLLYTYIEGITHFNRGIKSDWLSLFTTELLNKYIPYEQVDFWGRLESPRRSWLEFNEISVEEARVNIGSTLPTEDYLYIKSLVEKLYSKGPVQGEKYLLHGDTGVHNFVYDQSKLIGVIDPSPMAGPVLYDFLYAFVSSPDDIDRDTLFTAFDLLEQVQIDLSRLLEEAAVHLYCRIGLSLKHHPNDLPEYLAAWEQWKVLCK
ncbi:aminoglycoside phosphotransferase family protein [Cohnella cholangitidis]|uniref:Phosphotransferase n=1 Tax=Cohnella cholangitidis TaxID=2598458 RepID=A0A7G5BSV0_9BACL|nr:phosphotransferase [Cohnella cholangitidis]QMV40034.1 phosphotransferase [Cohnella cholangitidis]